MVESASFRSIAPGPSFIAEESAGSPASDGSKPGAWKKRVSTACLACKKSKRKASRVMLNFGGKASALLTDRSGQCSGTAPCDNCRAFNRECVFDESLDQRRRVAAKRTADELAYHRDLLDDLFKVMRSRDPSHAHRLIELVRHDASSDQIRAYIDDTLSTMKPSEFSGDQETVRKLEEFRRLIQTEGAASPSFRRKVMDVHYLCNDAPIKVPAKPWTTVTQDDDLVSHLVSLYFTWDWPFFAFLDFKVFVKHMAAGDMRSEFCNPLLVNALLANACVRCRSSYFVFAFLAAN